MVVSGKEDMASQERFTEKKVAEREGFEPSIEFPLCSFSKAVPSATRPSLRGERLAKAREE